MSSFDCEPDMQFAISCIDGRIAVPCRLPPALTADAAAPACRFCASVATAFFMP